MEVSDQSTVALILLTFIIKCSLHIIANSKAVVQRIRKNHRKTTVPESLYEQSCRTIKKETPIQCSLTTLPETAFDIKFFFNQFFTRIPEIIGTSRERFIFQIIGLFLLFMSTTIHKIFETNSSFYVKQCTTGKVQFLFFSSFLLVLTQFSF